MWIGLAQRRLDPPDYKSRNVREKLDSGRVRNLHPLRSRLVTKACVHTPITIRNN